MRSRIRLITVLCLVVILAAGATPIAAGNAGRARIDAVDLGREILPPNDGWAAEGAGTTGGSAADADHIFTVTNRLELVNALNNKDATPKIIYVQGTIYGNVDDNNQPLSCDDYIQLGYSLDAYLAAYDPAVWSWTKVPSGPLEVARKASQNAQAARIKIKVGSNTTLVGLGPDARMVGINLDVNTVDNIIIRNITFQDAYDCFPQWDPTDGSLGNWNSQYDTVSLNTATHVWVDHCAFNDGDHPDSLEPIYFGRPWQWHDGSLDITKGSDFVTVSWNNFNNHDKTMLIGSSDNPGKDPLSPAYDRGRLNVTVHHNVFDNVIQRLPRVRFGKVHVYNNYYSIPNADEFGYAWGAGIESQVYAENNYFDAPDVTPDRFIGWYKGTMMHVTGTYVNGTSAHNRVDVLAAYNAANPTHLLSPDVGWTPTLHTEIHPTQAVQGLVRNNAGTFH